MILDLFDARLQHTNGALLLIDFVILFVHHAANHASELRVPLVGIPRGGPGNDERGTRLINEDRVHLIHDHEVVAALHQLGRRPGHVVAQVVESKLVVGSVGDVARVVGAAFFGLLAREDHRGGHAKEAVNASHDLALVAREVVVHGHHVNALTREGVEVGRERGRHGLTFTGLHLGDVAEVKGCATHDLHVEGSLTQRSLGGFAHRSKGLRQEEVKAFAVGMARTEAVGLFAQFGVGEIDHRVFEGVDLGGDPTELLENPPLAHAKNSVKDGGHALLPDCPQACGGTLRTSYAWCPTILGARMALCVRSARTSSQGRIRHTELRTYFSNAHSRSVTIRATASPTAIPSTTTTAWTA